MNDTVELANSIHQFLLSPAAYPDHPQRVELKETHISWIYLTDRYAYKQKKPVKFEFLDFSTLSQREHYCHQEVTLNKRFSPDVYLGVTPVSRERTGKYRLQPGGEIVEWLVRMVRLDDGTTLENMIHDDRLLPTHVDQLSHTLTNFYAAQAPVMIRSNSFLQQLQHHVDANRNDLLNLLPEHEHMIRFATNAQQRCLALNQNHFLQRVADGRVVDGHGDLRPEHIYFRRSGPCIMDCIEFNPEYRTNDVIDELAFLAMECDRLGRDEIGRAVIDDYLATSSDEPQAFLQTFYRCYRACVRAKVAALRADQTHSRASQATAVDYLQLAMRYAEQLSPKLVIMIGGLSGTGKSTLAAALETPLAAQTLRTDVLRNEVLGKSVADKAVSSAVAANSSPTEDKARRNGHQNGNGKYSAAARQRVYEAMLDRMSDCLQTSPTLLLDGTFPTRALRQSVIGRAAELGARVLQVQCECPASEARHRIATRISSGDDASEAQPWLLDQQVLNYESMDDMAPLVRINTMQPLTQQVARVLSLYAKTLG